MRLYEGQVPELSNDIYEALVEIDAIEVESRNVDEVKRDIEAVLNEYIRVDDEIADEARERKIEEDDLTFGSAKRQVADEKGVGIGDDAVGYIIEQLIETFFHSNFVEEIFATDRKMRRNLAPIIEDYMSVDEELDEEVREQIKNEEEGTKEWEVEYQKVMNRLKRNRDLE